MVRKTRQNADLMPMARTLAGKPMDADGWRAGFRREVLGNVKDLQGIRFQDSAQNGGMEV